MSEFPVDPVASEPAADLTLGQKMGVLKAVGLEDFRESGPAAKAGMVATGGALFYEWGIGNEVVTPWITGLVTDRVEGPVGVAITAAASGAFTTGQQVVTGVLTAVTASQFPKLAGTAFDFLKDPEFPELNAKPWDELPRSDRWLSGFTLGTSYVAAREAAVTGNSTTEQLIPRVIGTSVITGCLVGAIASVAEIIDSATDAGPQIVESIGDITVDVVTNPLTWIGLLTVKAVHNRFKKRKIRNELRNPTVPETTEN